MIVSIYAVGIAEIICMGVCAAAAVAAVIGLFKKQPKVQLLRQICVITGNAAFLGTGFCFEFYRFWVG